MSASEHQLQHALIEWWKIKCKTFGLPEYCLFAIPNGGARNAVTGAILKREGVRKGVCDLMLVSPNKHYHGLFIEMKASKGVVAKEQQAFIDMCNTQGYLAIICYDWQTASDEITKYLTER